MARFGRSLPIQPLFGFPPVRPPVEHVIAVGPALESDLALDVGGGTPTRTPDRTVTVQRAGRRGGSVFATNNASVPPPAPSITAAVGAAVETDTAVSAGRIKTRAGTAAAESDSAPTAGRVKTRGVTAPVESDSAGAVSRVKVRAVAAATESESAQPVGRRKTRALTVAAETDAAGALSRVKTRAVALAAEADAALAVTARKTVAVGTAVESDTAVAVGTVTPSSRKTSRIVVVVGGGRRHATVLDVDGPVSGVSGVLPLGAAVETDDAPPVGATGGFVPTTTPAVYTTAQRAFYEFRLRPGQVQYAFAPVEVTEPVLPVTLASEIDAAQPVGQRKAKVVVLVVESDTAGVIARVKGRALGPAAEVETAGSVGARKTLAVGPAVEVDAALAVSASQTAQPRVSRPVVVTEARTAWDRLGRRLPPTVVVSGFGPPQAGLVGQAAEIDTAGAVSASKTRGGVAAVESDSARPVVASHARTITAAVESDAGRPIGSRKTRQLVVSVEVSTSRPVTASHRVTAAAAAEFDAARPMSHAKRRLVSPAAEADAAGSVGVRRAVLGAVEFDAALALPSALTPTPPTIVFVVEGSTHVVGAVSGDGSRAGSTADVSYTAGSVGAGGGVAVSSPDEGRARMVGVAE